jgi:hypothetical protein
MAKKKLYDKVLDLEVGMNADWIRAARLQKKADAGDKEAAKALKEMDEYYKNAEVVTMTEEEE